MKQNRLIFRKAKLLLVFAVVTVLGMTFANTVSAQGHHNTNAKGVTPTPDGTASKGYLAFIGNGRFRSVDGSIMKDGLVMGDGLDFQHNVRGRSDEEIEARRAEAVAFFKDRFGIDVEIHPGIVFTGYEVDPRINMRAYVVSGENVSKEGWKIDDGGFGAFVVDSAGVTLSGAWEGVHLPAASVLFFGEYVIRAEREDGEKEELVIHYESDIPFTRDQFGAGKVLYKAISEEFGRGFAGGITRFQFLDDDFLLQLDVRNIVTFPGIGSGI